jgi:glycine/D-amino acid oxidase-like deaminating enzyme
MCRLFLALAIITPTQLSLPHSVDFVKLRSGTPYWTASNPIDLHLQPLTTDIKCEIVVLGGGITGALIAHRLIKTGRNVVLLDRGEPGRGSTAASTGLLQYEIDTPLVDLVKKVGLAHAVHAYRRGQQAINEIEQLVEELDHDCGFVRRESLYFASRCWHERRLKREFECRRENGFAVDYLTRQELKSISSIDSVGAIRSRGDAQINPLRFTQSVIADALAKGLIAYGNANVQDIEERHDDALLKTEGPNVQAKWIVYAAGYQSEQHHSETNGSLCSTYAVTSQPNLAIDGWPDDCLIWETARPYFYARRTDDGRAMIGGADTAFSNDHDRDDMIERKVEELVERFHKLFPSTKFVPEYAWGGTFAGTKDGLAYIGQIENRARAYFALGYGGNGITFSMIAAKLISDLLAGQENPDRDVFRFGR